MFNKRNTILAIKLLISTLIIWYLCVDQKIDIRILFVFLSNKLDILYIFIFFLFVLYMPLIVRWKLLLKEFNINIEFFKLLKIGLASQFLGLLVPGSLGADAVKTIYLLRANSFDKDLKYKIIFCTILDKIVGLISLLLLLSIALLIKSEVNILINSVVILSIVGTFIYYCFEILKKFIMKKVKIFTLDKKAIMFRFINDARNLLIKRNALIIALLISFAVQINLALVIMYIASKVGAINIAYWDFFIISPLAELSTVIPVSPLGIGVGHLAYQEIFSMFGQQGGANIFNLVLLFKIMLSLLGFFSIFTNLKYKF